MCFVFGDGGWRGSCVLGCFWDFFGMNVLFGESGVFREVLLNGMLISSVCVVCVCRCVMAI